MAKYFTESEVRCKCGCGKNGMDSEFMAKLDQLREGLGFPLIVTSGYRCPSYNKRFGGKAPHETGMAVDLACSNPRAYQVVAKALELGFTGIGIAQGGDRGGRFIHLDTLPAPKYPRPAIWSY